jgi:hypothetical protein
MNMKKIIAITCTLLLTKFLFAQDSTTQKLEELITAYANIGRFNGSVLVARNDSILLQKGYGIKNATDDSMNDANTIFQIASVTKQFTATVILKLVELKKMALSPLKTSLHILLACTISQKKILLLMKQTSKELCLILKHLSLILRPEQIGITAIQAT